MTDWYDGYVDTTWVKPGMIIRIGRDATNPNDFELLVYILTVDPTNWRVACYVSNRPDRTVFTWRLPVKWKWQVRDESDWLITTLKNIWEPPADDVAPEHDDAA